MIKAWQRAIALLAVIAALGVSARTRADAELAAGADLAAERDARLGAALGAAAECAGSGHG